MLRAVPVEDEELTLSVRPDRGHRRDVDATALHRDAVAIWRLLRDLDADDHRTRSRLLQARADVRARSARLWRERGWLPITDDRGLEP